MAVMKRIALVGYGYWGPNLLRNFFETADCEVLYVCDLDLTRLKSVRKRYPSIMLTSDINEVLKDSDIDAVVIAVPSKYHFEIAKKCLTSQKDVLIEKPMTLSSKEATELVDLAKKNKRMIVVDHTFIFTEAVQKIKKLIDSGALGEIIYIDSVRVNLGLFQKDSNVFFDLATHDISIIGYLLGKQPTSVISTAIKKYGNQEEVGYIHLNYANNLSCNIHVSWLSPLKIRRMMIVGTKKMAVYDDIEQSEKVKIFDKGVTVDKLGGTVKELEQIRIGYRSGDIWSPNLEITEGLKTIAQEFIKSISTRKPSVSCGEFGLSVVEILEKSTESARTGKKVEFSYANKK